MSGPSNFMNKSASISSIMSASARLAFPLLFGSCLFLLCGDRSEEPNGCPLLSVVTFVLCQAPKCFVTCASPCCLFLFPCVGQPCQVQSFLPQTATHTDFSQKWGPKMSDCSWIPESRPASSQAQGFQDQEVGLSPCFG